MKTHVGVASTVSAAVSPPALAPGPAAPDPPTPSRTEIKSKNRPETLKTAKLRPKPGTGPLAPESINPLRRPQINTAEQKLLSRKAEKVL